MSKRKRTSEVEQWIKQGRTEGILMDWGTLPCLAIQHYYTDGIITASQVPKGVQEIDMTIYPNKVKYHERS